jgi:pyruvate kinase
MKNRYNSLKKGVRMIDLMTSTLEELVNLKESLLSIEANSDNKSIRNLEHYLELRKYNLTKLQDNLARLGLSSLGRSQPNIMDTLTQLISVISMALNKYIPQEASYLTFDEAYNIMNNRCNIFGKFDKTSIMLTLPSNTDRELVYNIADAGVDIFRINTAHDTKDVWLEMAEYIRDYNISRGAKKKIYVDLAGPKIRTGRFRKLPEAFEIGEKNREVDVIITKDGDTLPETETQPATISVNKEFFKKCRDRDLDYIEIIDMNNKKRFLKVVQKNKNSIMCKLSKKVMISEETIVKIYTNKKIYETNISNLYRVPEEIKVFKDDIVFITSDDIEGGNYYQYNEDIIPIIPCTNKDALKFVDINQRMFIDDGKIELMVIDKIIDTSGNGVIARVVLAREKGSIIREEKGINFPDSDIILPAITDDDRGHFDEIVDIVDIIGLSFAQTADDINILKNLIGDRDMGIVAKIETKTALKNLPAILKALLTHKNSGIMIARGDLAIETGFENLAYIQEMLLDMCEAAHIPVIFATQVLENQMKTNVPSRAEITDAAFSGRADCVMLNKGSFAVDTIKKLEYILEHTHQIFKKNRLLLTPWEI